MYISVEPKLGGPSYYTTSYELGSYAVLLETSFKIVYDDATRAAHVKALEARGLVIAKTYGRSTRHRSQSGSSVVFTRH